MEILLSNSSDEPIYEQITSQIEDHDYEGNFKERRCPSIYAKTGKGTSCKCHYCPKGLMKSCKGMVLLTQ